MATADKDGAIAQALSDRHACLLMSINEALAEATAGLNALMRDLGSGDSDG